MTMLDVPVDDAPLVLRRRLRAVAGPLAAAALFAGSTIGPRLADTVTSDPAEAAKVVAAVAAERDASTWAGMFLMVGLALLVPFFAGITAAIRSRGALVATIGGTLAMIGAACGALSQWFFFSEFQVTAPGVPRAASIAGLTSLQGWPGILLFLGFMGCLTIGWALRWSPPGAAGSSPGGRSVRSPLPGCRCLSVTHSGAPWSSSSPRSRWHRPLPPDPRTPPRRKPTPLPSEYVAV